MLIILAGALGALLMIVLLFRRLRRLSWQLTQLRVERDCERILHALGRGSVEIHLVEGEIAKDLSLLKGPVHRKGHLSLYRGGHVAAWVASRHPQRQLAATAGAATAAVAAAAVIALVAAAPTTDLPNPHSHSAAPGQFSTGYPPRGSSPPPQASSPPVNTSDQALVSSDKWMTPGHRSPGPQAPTSASPSPSPATPRPPSSTASGQPVPPPDPTPPKPSMPASSPSSTSLRHLCLDNGGRLDLDRCAGL